MPYLTGKVRLHTAYVCYFQIFICLVNGGARNLEVSIIEVLLYSQLILYNIIAKGLKFKFGGLAFKLQYSPNCHAMQLSLGSRAHKKEHVTEWAKKPTRKESRRPLPPMGHNMFTPTSIKFCHDYCLQLELHALSYVLLLVYNIYMEFCT